MATSAMTTVAERHRERFVAGRLVPVSDAFVDVESLLERHDEL